MYDDEKTCNRWGCTHTHTHTDTLENKNVRNDKSFYIPKNRRSLEERCEK